ncbi:unnamed protein product [Amoebophrya sp. A120]|nr:unnamed protein product [Amoebophrya sp. A120]|eukprot:GSA120T00022643001.1
MADQLPNMPQHSKTSTIVPTSPGGGAAGGRKMTSELELPTQALKREKEAKDAETLRGTMAVQIVDQSNMTEFEKKKEYYRAIVASFLNQQKFDVWIGVIIILNSLTIGWETQLNVEDENTDAFTVIENMFLFIYVVELSARFFAFGVMKSLKSSGWIVFDTFLVVVGVVSQWVLPIIFADTPSALEPLMVLRVLRLLRLARAVRLIITFKTLWMLVRGLLTSADTIMFTFILIAGTVYLFAVLGVELITKNRQHYIHGDDGTYAPAGTYKQLMDEDFDSLFSVMLTLLSFVTLDSINRIYAPMIKFQPAYFFYFVPFILAVSIAMMNLVTAVLVENALESSKNDKEVNAVYAKKKLEQMMPQIKAIFVLLDRDGSGEISKEELLEGLETNPEIEVELQHFLGNESPVQLFDTLDVDGDNSVGIDEFCDLMRERVTSEAPIELTKVLKIAKQTKNDVQKMLTSHRMQLASGGLSGGSRTRSKSLLPPAAASGPAPGDVEDSAETPSLSRAQSRDGGAVSTVSVGGGDAARVLHGQMDALNGRMDTVEGKLNRMTDVLDKIHAALELDLSR